MLFRSLWFNAGLGTSSPRAGRGSRYTSEDVLLPPGLRCLANDYGQNPVFCGKTQSPNGKYVLDVNRSHQRISATARAALASLDSVDAVGGPSPSEAMTQHARGGAAQHRASTAPAPHQARTNGPAVPTVVRSVDTAVSLCSWTRSGHPPQLTAEWARAAL